MTSTTRAAASGVGGYRGSGISGCRARRSGGAAERMGWPSPGRPRPPPCGRRPEVCPGPVAGRGQRGCTAAGPGRAASRSSSISPAAGTCARPVRRSGSRPRRRTSCGGATRSSPRPGTRRWCWRDARPSRCSPCARSKGLLSKSGTGASALACACATMRGCCSRISRGSTAPPPRPAPRLVPRASTSCSRASPALRSPRTWPTRARACATRPIRCCRWRASATWSSPATARATRAVGKRWRRCSMPPPRTDACRPIGTRRPTRRRC